jgi:hypothetical protein
MKNKSSLRSAVPTFTAQDIRDYAAHLWEQSGRVAGRDEDNWFEAKACLEANIPRADSHRRLQRHLSPGRKAAARAPAAA